MLNTLRPLLTDTRWLPLRRGLLGAIWVVLATLTHIPVPQAVQSIGRFDKVAHLVMYFPLGLLLPVCQIRGCQKWWVCLLVIAGYGVLDELLQIPVGRTASVFDWLADVAGACAGLVTLYRICRQHS